MMLRYTIFFFTILLSSCKINSSIELVVENTTLHEVDTLKVFLQMKEYKLTNLSSGSISKMNVPIDSLETNHHDFTIQATGIMNDNRKINGFYYTDLSGVPGKEYTVIILDTIVVIKPE